MQLTSPAFEHKGKIPSKYTCDGENISPELNIKEIPEGTETLVLLMDDPDVPKTIREDGMWDHWVIFNIPKDTTVLTEGMKPLGIEGKNTRGDNKYGGPCPPDKEHRYFFKLYALNITLNLTEESTKTQIEQAMQGHILEETTLMGTYNRKQNLKTEPI
jgi:Raf kinase inhibitor-like YbhB/YbcL family protein|tara:strand:- start:5145 stop:5621 length:477 start_codon:yes stop_codon:yes gene_type:complete